VSSNEDSIRRLVHASVSTRTAVRQERHRRRRRGERGGGGDVQETHAGQRRERVIRVNVHGLAPRHVTRRGVVERGRERREPREKQRAERRGDPERHSPGLRGVRGLAFEGLDDLLLLVRV